MRGGEWLACDTLDLSGVESTVAINDSEALKPMAPNEPISR